MAVFFLLALALQDPEVDAFLKQLEDESIELREKATAALIGLGSKAEPGVKDRVASSTGEVKIRAQSILREIMRRRSLEDTLPRLQLFSPPFEKGRVRDAIDHLARTSNMNVILGPGVDAEINLRFRDAPLLQVLDELCKAGDLNYHLSNGPAGGGGRSNVRWVMLRLTPGPHRVTPRQFVRHYAVSVERVSVRRSNDFVGESSVTSVDVALQWIPGVIPNAHPALEITSITDDKGRALKGGFDAERPLPNGIARELLLDDREADATKVTLRGRATLSYPSYLGVLTFEDPAKSVGQKQEYDGVTVVLRRFEQKDGTCTITLETSGTSPQGRDGLGEMKFRHWGMGAARIRLRIRTGFAPQEERSVTIDEGTARVTHIVHSEVALPVQALELWVDREQYRDRFDFELKDIPLPK